jgi:sulfite exporter TauE/SafE
MNEVLFGIVSGLAIGSVGSFHCLGMCGPIALSLPIAAQSKTKTFLSVGLYNVGRAMTYGLLGVFFGWLGSRFSIWGIQQWISILAGVVLLAFVFFHFRIRLPGKGFDRFQSWVREQLRQLLRVPLHARSFLLIGLLNGLLPCGLVYVAIVAAMATGKIWMSALLMFSFGLGTLPMMAGITVVGRQITVRQRQRINKLIPYMISAMALLLILRGLNLGIPYVSPRMGDSVKEVPNCHGEEEEEVFPVPK